MKYLDRYIDVLYCCTRGWRTSAEVQKFANFRQSSADRTLAMLAERGVLLVRKRMGRTSRRPPLEYRINCLALAWRGPNEEAGANDGMREAA